MIDQAWCLWFKLTPYHEIRFTHTDGMTGPMQCRLRKYLCSGVLSFLFPSRLSREPLPQRSTLPGCLMLESSRATPH
jgi:hypothetical protein